MSKDTVIGFLNAMLMVTTLIACTGAVHWLATHSLPLPKSITGNR